MKKHDKALKDSLAHPNFMNSLHFWGILKDAFNIAFLYFFYHFSFQQVHPPLSWWWGIKIRKYIVIYTTTFRIFVDLSFQKGFAIPTSMYIVNNCVTSNVWPFIWNSPFDIVRCFYLTINFVRNAYHFQPLNCQTRVCKVVLEKKHIR